MKTLSFILTAMLFAVVSQAQPQSFPPLGRLPPTASTPGSPPSVAPDKESANYLVRVDWKDSKHNKEFLELITAEGQFSLDTVSGKEKISDFEVPITVKLNGTLTVLSPEKGRLQLFLGRTVPYVTGAYPGPIGKTSASYSQLSVGLSSTFVVTFGKPLLVQSDDSGEVTILVKRMTD